MREMKILMVWKNLLISNKNKILIDASLFFKDKNNGLNKWGLTLFIFIARQDFCLYS